MQDCHVPGYKNLEASIFSCQVPNRRFLSFAEISKLSPAMMLALVFLDLTVAANGQLDAASGLARPISVPRLIPRPPGGHPELGQGFRRGIITPSKKLTK